MPCRFSAPAAAQGTPWTGPTASYAIYAAAVAWWVGAMASVIGSLEPQSRLRLIGRTRGLMGGAIRRQCAGASGPGISAAATSTPAAPIGGNSSTRFIDEKTGQAPACASEIARLEKAQPALLQAEVARLAPPRKGATDVYALGIAGWADQDVFVKELDGGLQAIASVLPIKDRTSALSIDRDTLETIPLADLQNFQAAVHAIGDVMDKDNDILVLFMTSHGEKTGFALELPGAVAELTPQQVASTLDGAGIKNRIVIVSACYSGIFVPPLKNDNTIVLTASDAQNTSFGCAPERDWTYFGDAFFRQSLHPGTDFENAFDHARILIQGWELMDHAPPSNPQGEFGRALVDKLAPLFAAAQSVGAVDTYSHGADHATSRARPQALSDAHKPRSRRKRSSGADELMARMR